MINAGKTKTTVIEKTKETPISITIQVEAIEQVGEFVYLGGLINADGSNEKDIQRRIGRTSQAFWNNEQDMEKQRIYKENKDKNIRDDDTTYFLVRIRMLDNAKTR